MKNINFVPKLKASGLHFIASLFFFSALISILVFFWYPEPYFTATGGLEGLKIVALVDLVLGPLLTLIAYNALKPKKELRNDLLIIVCIQISALVWGINTIYLQRPIAIVFWENAFYSVAYKEINDDYKDNKISAKLIKEPRKLYFVAKPITIKNLLELNQEVQTKKSPPYHLIERYVDYKDNFSTIKKHNVDIQEVIAINSAMGLELEKILTSTNSSLLDNIYIALNTKYQNIILIFSDNGEQIGYLKAPLKKP